MAIERGRTALVKLLLKNGANVNHIDHVRRVEAALIQYQYEFRLFKNLETRSKTPT